MGINRDRDVFLDANDAAPDRRPPSSCSASRIGEAPQEEDLAALLFAILGLAFVRRRTTRQ
jgi:hypothetical protein